MRHLEDLSCLELGMIKMMIGEAFVTNARFHEFGHPQERKALVMQYMDAYVDYLYECGALYETDDGSGYIGLACNKELPLKPKMKLIWRMCHLLPGKVRKRYLHYMKQIEKSSSEYSKKPHIKVMLFCVDPACQGQGITKPMMDFAKEMADSYQLPLLFDTDMRSYSKLYQYLGCELYSEKKADNGVTRYNLVYRP